MTQKREEKGKNLIKHFFKLKYRADFLPPHTVCLPRYSTYGVVVRQGFVHLHRNQGYKNLEEPAKV